jgi:hypothetical protein
MRFPSDDSCTPHSPALAGLVEHPHWFHPSPGRLHRGIAFALHSWATFSKALSAGFMGRLCLIARGGRASIVVAGGPNPTRLDTTTRISPSGLVASDRWAHQ